MNIIKYCKYIINNLVALAHISGGVYVCKGLDNESPQEPVLAVEEDIYIPLLFFRLNFDIFLVIYCSYNIFITQILKLVTGTFL